MNFNDLNPPIVELPTHKIWHRIQRTRARTGSVRARGLILPPVGTMAGRFDLQDEPVGYLADSPVTALYESLFRRESIIRSLDELKQRDLVAFSATRRLRLVDLRGLEERYPVLQSQRYGSSQAFARNCRLQDVDGVLYASAQHPRHDCLCVFETGIGALSRLTKAPLVEPGSNRLHQSVVAAAIGSQVPIVDQ
ncbi:RES family NAD+ phosphorylase [Variovorax sp. LT1P1]|uniref:RES family NAD+ phosphorylase n=1 Tax=Variovorax sp. LT1P1 TaxID=3443730 RepID=UPI003F45F812